MRYIDLWYLILGGLCLIWVVVWFYQIRDSPQQHPRISEAELKYITENIEYDTSKKVHINYKLFTFLSVDMKILTPRSSQVHPELQPKGVQAIEWC